MPTSQATFSALPFLQQIPLVWVEGTFLARRWEEEDGVALYHMKGGFFCELYLNPDTMEMLWLHSFTSTEHLGNYTDYIQLDDLAT